MENKTMEIVGLEKELPAYAQEAEDFAVITEQDMVTAEARKQFIKKRIAFAKDQFKPIEQKQKEAKDETKKLKDSIIDPMESVVKVYHLKIGDYFDLVEEQSRQEAERIAEEQRKEKDKELKRINKKLDGFQNSFAKLTDQKWNLENVLESPTTSHEEAELIRARIDTIDRQLDATTDKAVDTQVKLDEVVEPMPVIPEKTDYDKRSYGKFLDPTVVNPKAVIRSVFEGKTPISVIKFDMAVIKKLVNANTNIPGVKCTEKRKGT